MLYVYIHKYKKIIHDENKNFRLWNVKGHIKNYYTKLWHACNVI